MEKEETTIGLIICIIAIFVTTILYQFIPSIDDEINKLRNVCNEWNNLPSNIKNDIINRNSKILEFDSNKIEQCGNLNYDNKHGTSLTKDLYEKRQLAKMVFLPLLIILLILLIWILCIANITPYIHH